MSPVGLLSAGTGFCEAMPVDVDEGAEAAVDAGGGADVEDPPDEHPARTTAARTPTVATGAKDLGSNCLGWDMPAGWTARPDSRLTPEHGVDAMRPSVS